VVHKESEPFFAIGNFNTWVWVALEIPIPRFRLSFVRITSNIAIEAQFERVGNVGEASLNLETGHRKLTRILRVSEPEPSLEVMRYLTVRVAVYIGTSSSGPILVPLTKVRVTILVK
jgi:hypothetical protein